MFGTSQDSALWIRSCGLCVYVCVCVGIRVNFNYFFFGTWSLWERARAQSRRWYVRTHLRTFGTEDECILRCSCCCPLLLNINVTILSDLKWRTTCARTFLTCTWCMVHGVHVYVREATAKKVWGVLPRWSNQHLWHWTEYIAWYMIAIRLMSMRIAMTHSWYAHALQHRDYRWR